jgi:hypothetical protein
MNLLPRFRRVLVAGVAAAAATSTLTGFASAPAQQLTPPEINVPAGHHLFLVGHAVGVQIYTCDGSTWGSATPRADLFEDDAHTQLIMTHFGGPTWEATDGSSIVGVLPPQGSVTVDPTAIPWLLLDVDPVDPSETPGRLAATTYIQRVETTGGLAPAAADCNAGTANKVVEVPYTSDYNFWKADG